MTLNDYEDLCGYWLEHPPVQLMAQAYFGYKPKGKPGAARGQPMLP